MNRIIFFLFVPLQLLAQSSITLRHINIVNVKTGIVTRNQMVTITGNRIASIKQDNDKQISHTGEAVDGSNKFLIPGLWDMHSHDNGDVKHTKEYKIPMMLANGVTGLRNMSGKKEEVQLRDSINKNLLVGPRMIVGSPLVNGPKTIFNNSIIISGVTRVPKVVDSLINIGYDFIKVYSFLRSDIFFALADYCKKKHMPIAGHVPIGVTVEQASAAGLQSIEHLTGFRRSFALKAGQSSKQWEREFLDTSGLDAYINILFKSDAPSIAFDTALADKVTKKIISNHTAVVPTIIVFHGFEFNRDTLMKMPLLSYVSKDRQQDWYKFRETHFNEKGFTQSALQLLKYLHKQGVMIMAGSDNENPFTIDGFSLHDELEYYIQAGFTPLEALQTATINPAIFLHKEKDLGTVEQGKLADLVILEKNPLTDIKNTRAINAVIINGHLINKRQIEERLKALKERLAKE